MGIWVIGHTRRKSVDTVMEQIRLMLVALVNCMNI
jgi:hypothetical protein